MWTHRSLVVITLIVRYSTEPASVEITFQPFGTMQFQVLLVHVNTDDKNACPKGSPGMLLRAVCHSAQRVDCGMLGKLVKTSAQL